MFIKLIINNIYRENYNNIRIICLIIINIFSRIILCTYYELDDSRPQDFVSRSEQVSVRRNRVRFRADKEVYNIIIYHLRGIGYKMVVTVLHIYIYILGRVTRRPVGIAMKIMYTYTHAYNSTQVYLYCVRRRWRQSHKQRFRDGVKLWNCSCTVRMCLWLKMYYKGTLLSDREKKKQK